MEGELGMLLDSGEKIRCLSPEAVNVAFETEGDRRKMWKLKKRGENVE